jgi:hypothetical protein
MSASKHHNDEYVCAECEAGGVAMDGERCVSFMEVAPAEVLYCIFASVEDTKQLVRMSGVCQRWYYLINETQELFRAGAQRDFGLDTKHEELEWKEVYKRCALVDMSGDWSFEALDNTQTTVSYDMMVTHAGAILTGRGVFPAQHDWPNPIDYVMNGSITFSKKLEVQARILWTNFGESTLSGKIIIEPNGPIIIGSWQNDDTQKGTLVARRRCTCATDPAIAVAIAAATELGDQGVIQVPIVVHHPDA